MHLSVPGAGVTTSTQLSGSTLDGGMGNDILRGNSGADRLIGGIGTDTLDGAGDNDFLNGGRGNNSIDGGAGTDTAFLGTSLSSFARLENGGATYLISRGEAHRLVNVENVQVGGVTSSLANALVSTSTFNALIYLASFADLRAAFGTDTAAATNHYINSGFAEGRDAYLFDPLAYLASYADLRNAFGTDITAATRHYITSGAAEGRTLNFDPLSYLATYADLRAVFGSDTAAATRHYVDYGAAENRIGSFNALGYIASYADLIVSLGTDTASAMQQYLTVGVNEGRSVTFDAFRYIASYADLISTYGTDAIGATRHYIENGYDAGRRATFESLVYTASYADLIGAFGTNQSAAARHYIASGRSEGRQLTFDPVDYAAYNPDVAAFFGNNREALARHYIEYGYAEGRATGPLYVNAPSTTLRTSLATAISVNGFFTLASDSTIGNSTTIPHATIRAQSTGQAEWYRVRVDTAGTIRLDIDNGSFDTVISLHNASGTQLAENDDMTSLDPGSSVIQDSFLTYNVVTPGVYYVRVVAFGTTTTPANGSYRLHISVPGAPLAPAAAPTEAESGVAALPAQSDNAAQNWAIADMEQQFDFTDMTSADDMGRILFDDEVGPRLSLAEWRAELGQLPDLNHLPFIFPEHDSVPLFGANGDHPLV
jgi:serralysin